MVVTLISQICAYDPASLKFQIITGDAKFLGKG